MNFKKAKVFILATTEVYEPGMKDALVEMGVPNWTTDAGSGGEKLIEFMGRLCYKSFEPGKNPNVTKVRKGFEKYVKNILACGHGSVLEHGSVSVAFLNVTRVFTHEIVRHRVGTAFSQESLRFVRLEDLSMYFPDAFADTEEAEALKLTLVNAMLFSEVCIKDISDITGIEEMKSFNLKKRITSAQRRVAPIGMCTNIGVTCNHRTWRHIFEMRCSEHSEEEIRAVMVTTLHMFQEKWPHIYGDIKVTANSLSTEYKKV